MLILFGREFVGNTRDQEDNEKVMDPDVTLKQLGISRYLEISYKFKTLPNRKYENIVKNEEIKD